MDVKQEIEALRAEIMEHNRHYYDEDAPVISDFEYDALMRRLEELEAAHPEFYSPTSPTQKVGGTAKSTFAPVTHEVPLESLNDVFSFDELREFDERMLAALEADEGTLILDLEELSEAEAAARLREWAETVLDWAHHKKFDPLMKLRGKRRRTGLGGV